MLLRFEVNYVNKKISELANFSRSFDEKEWFIDQYFVICNGAECLDLGSYSLKPLSRIEYSEVKPDESLHAPVCMLEFSSNSIIFMTMELPKFKR